MTSGTRSPEALLAENEELRLRLEEAEETLRAIGSGEVDAFVVSGPEGAQVFALKGAEHPYRVLVETMNEGAATLAADGTILYCNNRLAAMLQVPLERLVGTRLGKYVNPADVPLFEARLGRCTDECDSDEISMINGAGNAVPVLISCCAADISSNREISMVVTDLTQQKRNEEIVASERLARSIIEQAGEAIIVCDATGQVIRASGYAQKLCGVNPLLEPFDRLFPMRVTDSETLFSVATPLAGRGFENVEVAFRRSDGETFHLLLNAASLTNVQNEIFGCVVTLTDITERKLAEERLKISLQEKEVLLKEVHHRVKNNLQVVTSLVSLQADTIDNPDVRALFQDVRNRVRSMALVHEKLYQSDDLSGVEFSEYCRSLLNSIWRGHRNMEADVRLMLEMQPLLLPMELAVPCGLILNELATNALKHAFRGRSQGDVRVGLQSGPDKSVSLSVGDNGVGFPHGLDWRESPSLGLKLVQMLAGQLKATVEVNTGAGAEFRISFKLNDTGNG